MLLSHLKLYLAQCLDLNADMIAGREPFRLDQAAEEHELPAFQSPSALCPRIGEPCQRIEGMAEHHCADTVPDFGTIDQCTPFQGRKIKAPPIARRVAQHATSI